MAVRIYPSQQDTNTTAKGSVIITFDKSSYTIPLSYIQLSIIGNSQFQYRQNRKSEGVYAINLPTLSTISQLQIVSSGGAIESYNIYLREYTTDDQSADNGIIETFITGYTGTSASFSIVPSIRANTYKYEYRIKSDSKAP